MLSVRLAIDVLEPSLDGDGENHSAGLVLTSGTKVLPV